MSGSASMEELKVPFGVLCLIAFVGVACKLSSLTGAKMTKSREVVFGSINIHNSRSEGVSSRRKA